MYRTEINYFSAIFSQVLNIIHFNTITGGSYGQESFRRNLRVLRKAKGLSQSEMAEEIGVSAAYVSRVERGVKIPSIYQYEAIMQTLGEYSGNYVTVFMPKEQIAHYRILSKLHCAIRDGRVNEEKLLLQEMECDDGKIEDDFFNFICMRK